MITFFKSIKAKKNPIILFILILCLNGMVSIYVNKKEYIPLQKIHGFKLEVYYMESTPEIIENLITKRLVEILEEDGHIEPSQSSKSNGTGVRRPNINDQIFWESLDKLAKCRDLLSIEEENFINNLGNKFKHLR